MREIDIFLLKENYQTIKLKCNKKVCAMVKADAYGHGLKNICENLDPDYFGVATFEEAKQIRAFDNVHKVLLVGYCPYKYIIDASALDVEITISSLQQLHGIIEILKDKDIKINCHIKINSGMNRFGVKTIKEFNLIQKILKNQKNIKFCGLFTHFCSINCDENYFKRQCEIFKLFIKSLDNCFSPIIHIGGGEILNSNLDFEFDMIRCGLNLYGYSKSINVKPVMKLVSYIAQINDVIPYEMTGYYPCLINSAYRRVATIFYGYSDGVPKQLSNKAYVKINNALSKVVGVCMDWIICDVSNIKCKIGDEVEVMSSASEWAKILEISEYEVLTGFKNLRDY